MSDVLTVGSLFAGIGGIELGLERTGRFRTVWQVENDDYANKVLAKHWPEVRRYGDIRTLDAAELERVDVICGGFPCQDISNAGKREGIDGERSGLWAEYARLIRELRPRYALLENVSALLHRGLGRVLGDLASCGYDAEWQCLPAAAFGAPHIRDRAFIVAYPRCLRCYTRRAEQSLRGPGAPGPPRQAKTMADPDSTGCQEQCGAKPMGTQQRPVECGCSDVADATHTDDAQRRCASGGTQVQPGRSSRRVFELRPTGTWAVEPNVGRVANGVPSRVDRLRCLGNAVVPQVAQYVGECIIAHYDAVREAAG